MVSYRNRSGNLEHHLGDNNGLRHIGALDHLDVGILKELVGNPYASSTKIASKYEAPLSTVQRRRARLEKLILAKEYSIDVRTLGWRTGDLLIAVEKGKAEETANLLLKNKDSNVVIASLRIGHPKVDVMAGVFYRDSQELHKLTETVRAMHYVSAVEWAEVIKVVGRNTEIMFNKVFS